MEFRLAFNPKEFDIKIEHQHQLFLIGSCFTEQIGKKLSDHKFSIIDNPHGILFNPISIVQSLQSYIHQKQYQQNDLFLHNELWGSWDHHTKFSSIDSALTLNKINTSQQKASTFLASVNWLIITLGSAFVYELEEGRVVANCHKVPTDKFSKRLLATNEIVESFNALMHELKSYNPSLKIIFTISPVRHLRDGFVENNRSKSALIQAVHELINVHNNAFYFPAYELVIDDLRDYRFFAEDMVHPNYAATNYVWEKFNDVCLSTDSKLLMKDIHQINLAKNHKPFNPSSQQHKAFLQQNLNKLKVLQSQHTYLNLEEDIVFFENSIKMSEIEHR